MLPGSKQVEALRFFTETLKKNTEERVAVAESVTRIHEKSWEYRL